jgi:hypothetical protein
MLVMRSPEADGEMVAAARADAEAPRQAEGVLQVRQPVIPVQRRLPAGVAHPAQHRGEIELAAHRAPQHPAQLGALVETALLQTAAVQRHRHQRPALPRREALGEALILQRPPQQATQRRAEMVLPAVLEPMDQLARQPLVPIGPGGKVEKQIEIRAIPAAKRRGSGGHLALVGLPADPAIRRRHRVQPPQTGLAKPRRSRIRTQRILAARAIPRIHQTQHPLGEGARELQDGTRQWHSRSENHKAPRHGTHFFRPPPGKKNPSGNPPANE